MAEKKNLPPKDADAFQALVDAKKYTKKDLAKSADMSVPTFNKKLEERKNEKEKQKLQAKINKLSRELSNQKEKAKEKDKEKEKVIEVNFQNASEG